MNRLNIILLLSLPSLIFFFNPRSEVSLSQDERNELIDSFVESETEFAAANCFCRIGDDRGYQVKDYPRALKDFGSLKRYTGVRQQSKKNQAECGRLCSAKAFQYATSLSNDALCQYAKKNGPVKIVAYSKVGTKNWTVRQTLKMVNCCHSPGVVQCPSGWNSEHKNFPGQCSKAICPPAIKGDRRLYTDKGVAWGFIYKDMTYQLTKARVTGAGFKACN